MHSHLTNTERAERVARRRRAVRRSPAFLGAAAVLAAGAAFGIKGADDAAPEVEAVHAEGIPATFAAAPGARRDADRPRPDRWPPAGTSADARAIALERGGLVSFAAMGPHGEVLGFHENRRYVSASVVKAMLLVAELQRLEHAGADLDPATAATLRAMITYSDNDAADSIYYRVGDQGLYDVAARARMKRFAVDGYWANAQITAADMATFMWRLDRLLDVPDRRFANEALAGIVGSQRWGIPDAVPERARVRFKGGWVTTDLGQLVHQAARVDLDGRRYAVAVLTDGQPSMEHGVDTVRALAAKLLGGAPERPPG